MSHRRTGLARFGMALTAVLALMAFAASAALAETGNWRIEGANINMTKEFEGEKDSNGFKFKNAFG